MTLRPAARLAARLTAAVAAHAVAIPLAGLPAPAGAAVTATTDGATVATTATPERGDVAARPAPTAAGWIAEMNRQLDKSGSFFIADYGDPGYFDWSSDECSWSPDSNPYGFKWACRRHDFGWRNLKRGESRYGRNMWNLNNKAVVDRQFHADMYTHCRVEHGNSANCRRAADGYHSVVSRVEGNTVGMNRHTLYLY